MKQDALQLAQALVSIPSVSQWSNAAISDYIEEQLRAAGFQEIERLEYTFKSAERKVNLVAKKGTGKGGLAFLAHSDTVPGQEAEWDAFNPIVRAGRLYGRGSCDMKGPLAAALVAAAAVDAAALAEPIYLVITSDEEIGLYGAKHVVRHSQLLRESGPRYGVVIEPTGLVPVHGHKGYGFIRVTARGKAAHTSSGEGISATFLLAPFLAEMAALHGQFQSDPSFRNEAFQPPTNGFNMVLSDNGSTNTTASEATCTLTMRTMPDARCEETIDLIVARAAAYGFETKVGVSPVVYTPIASPLVQAACAATGNENPETVPFGTDGFHFQQLMPLVILGPGDIALAHTVGESLPIAELEAAVAIYQRMIAILCQQARPT